MNTEYRIKSAGEQFIMIDPVGQQVGAYHTEEAAKADMERRHEEQMRETAKLLLDVAVKAHMKIFSVDRETASYWVRRAAETESQEFD
jgi:hypothetical protein